MSVFVKFPRTSRFDDFVFAIVFLDFEQMVAETSTAKSGAAAQAAQ